MIIYSGASVQARKAHQWLYGRVPDRRADLSGHIPYPYLAINRDLGNAVFGMLYDFYEQGV